MRIHVLCFASVRDVVGAGRIELEMAAGATVDTALAALADRTPQLGPLLGTLRVAVDEEFAAGADVLHPGATLALLPPVSGG